MTFTNVPGMVVSPSPIDTVPPADDIVRRIRHLESELKALRQLLRVAVQKERRSATDVAEWGTDAR